MLNVFSRQQEQSVQNSKNFARRVDLNAGGLCYDLPVGDSNPQDAVFVTHRAEDDEKQWRGAAILFGPFVLSPREIKQLFSFLTIADIKMIAAQFLSADPRERLRAMERLGISRKKKKSDLEEAEAFSLSPSNALPLHDSMPSVALIAPALILMPGWKRLAVISTIVMRASDRAGRLGLRAMSAVVDIANKPFVGVLHHPSVVTVPVLSDAI